MPSLDLTAIPVVDNHCHPILREGTASTVEGWRAFFSEAAEETQRVRDVPFTVFYRRLLRALGRFHGCAGTEEGVLAARGALEPAELRRRLGADAGIAGLVLDTGLPVGERVLPNRDFADAFGARHVELLRLELLFQQLVARHATLADVREALAVELRDLRASGYAGVKSIVGYRTGLEVRAWSGDEAATAFGAARVEVAATGRVRLGHKPLLDTLLHDALALAARQELPAQFHVGYGDPDVDLRLANPLHLRGVITDPELAGLHVVLLHACWPFFREGAFLATVYPNVHLDLSYAIPFLGFPEYVAATRAALSVAPWTKLLYSSDAAHLPELHWIGARDGRRAVGEALGQLVHDGDLTTEEAMAAARAFLHDNAAVLYGLGPTLAGGAS